MDRNRTIDFVVDGRLHATRDFDYRAVLDLQKDQRAELITRQDLGLVAPHLTARP